MEKALKNVYASKYLTYLPTKEELIKIIRDEKELLEKMILEQIKQEKNINNLNRKVIYAYIKCVYVLEDNKIKIEYKN